MHNQRRDVDSSQVLPEVFMPGRHTCKAGGSRGAGGEIPTRPYNFVADSLPQQLIRVVEIFEELGKECVAVCNDRLLDAFEDTGIHALGIVRCLEQEWRNSRENYSFADALGAKFPNVTRHFSSTHGEPDQRDIVQLEVLYE